MTHTVAVGEFKGPPGILLDLVERKKFEVTTISVAGITASYLEYIHKLKETGQTTAEELSDFVQLGARLLYIKSLALLPQETAGDSQDEELRKLNLELEEYRKMQAAARLLGQMQRNPAWERQVAGQLDPTDLPMPNIEPSELAQALASVLKRIPAPEPQKAIERKRISFQKIIQRLRGQLSSGFSLQNQLAHCQDRLEAVITFLAVLELVREGQAVARQAGQFDAIWVEAAHE